MAITSIKTGSSFTNLVKYNDFLAGNAAFSPSSYESIASVTAAGGETSLTFSSIAGTYKHLQIRSLVRSTTSASASSAYMNMNFNGDTGSNYAVHVAGFYGNNTNNIYGSPSNGNAQIGVATLGGTAASIFGVAITDIIDYASTTKYKTVRDFSGANANTTGAAFAVTLDSSLWMSTSAITSIAISGLTFAAGSTVALYGIKG